MNDPLIRPGCVDWLAAAYRAKYDDPAGSALADLVLTNRHRDFTREECREALGRVLAETHADLAVATARAGFSGDPVSARLEALLMLDDGELDELQRAGLLDRLEL